MKSEQLDGKRVVDGLMTDFFCEITFEIRIVARWGEYKDDFFQKDAFAQISVPVRGSMRQKTKHIVALGGKAGSGKNATAEELVRQYGFTALAFADPIRDAAKELNPLVPIDMGHNGELIKSTMRLATLVDSVGWETAKREVPEVRDILQRLGTEVGRQLIDPSVWVTMAMKRANEIDGHVVFTDCRFPNEVEAVRNQGGLFVRIHRNDIDPVNEHVSETAIDDIPADLTVLNLGLKSDLADHARTIFLTLSLKELHS